MRERKTHVTMVFNGLSKSGRIFDDRNRIVRATHPPQWPSCAWQRCDKQPSPGQVLGKRVVLHLGCKRKPGCGWQVAWLLLAGLWGMVHTCVCEDPTLTLFIRPDFCLRETGNIGWTLSKAARRMDVGQGYLRYRGPISFVRISQRHFQSERGIVAVMETHFTEVTFFNNIWWRALTFLYSWLLCTRVFGGVQEHLQAFMQRWILARMQGKCCGQWRLSFLPW